VVTLQGGINSATGTAVLVVRRYTLDLLPAGTVLMQPRGIEAVLLHHCQDRGLVHSDPPAIPEQGGEVGKILLGRAPQCHRERGPA
jgi:hypothetical protein